MESQQSQSAPYAPTTAGLGGLPTTSVDAPISSVFLVLFIIGAAMHMTILQLNRRHGHKFLASGALFGFCMARITTCTMRLVWSTHQTSVPIAIAANVFVSAGVIIIIIINLIFGQRVMRASHPRLGWARTTHYLFLAFYASIILMLAALITSIVQQSYTLDANIHRIDHDIQLVGSTYFAFAAFFPVVLLVIGVLLPKLRTPAASRTVEKFGTGRFRSKILILIFSTLLIALGAGFRTGIAYNPRPANDPAWYHSRACFYTFNFTVEIIVIYLYAFIRVDRRFYVPDGSKGPGDYARDGQGKVERRVVSEEEFLDDFRPVAEKGDEAGAVTAGGEDGTGDKWQNRAQAELENGIREPPTARVV